MELAIKVVYFNVGQLGSARLVCCIFRMRGLIMNAKLGIFAVLVIMTLSACSTTLHGNFDKRGVTQQQIQQDADACDYDITVGGTGRQDYPDPNDTRFMISADTGTRYNKPPGYVPSPQLITPSERERLIALCMRGKGYTVGEMTLRRNFDKRGVTQQQMQQDADACDYDITSKQATSGGGVGGTGRQDYPDPNDTRFMISADTGTRYNKPPGYVPSPQLITPSERERLIALCMRGKGYTVGESR
jgi:hypothetical protein